MASKSQHLSLDIPDKGVGEWDIPLNDNFTIIDNQFSGAAQVGHTHTGVSGQGPKINHSDLNDAGSTSHADIDTHIADASIHGPFVDELVGSVTGTDTGNQVTFTDISEIQFKNATVSQTTQGIVLVSAQAQTAAEDLLNNTVTSASLVWVDNFNWLVGEGLGSNCWVVSKTQDGAEFFVNNQVGQGSGTRAELNLVGPVLGVVNNLSSCHVPHSYIQRVSVTVSSLTSSEVDVTLSDDDAFTLSLDLLSSSGENTISRPLAQGLSLIISKPVGTPNINYTISARTLDGTEVQLPLDTAIDALFSQDQQFIQEYNVELRKELLVGCHEFSLSRDKVDFQNTGFEKFTLHYYYNHRLVASVEAHPTLGSVSTPEHQLYERLGAIAAALGGTKQPQFGRVGFSVGYEVQTGSTANLQVKCVTIAGQDDIFNATIPVLPGIDDPDPGGGGEEPCCPPSTPGSDVWVDTPDPIDIGDLFDFDGAGYGNDSWLINATTPGTTVEGTLGEDFVGFQVVEQNVATPRVFTAFCAPPVVDPALGSSDVGFFPLLNVVGGGSTSINAAGNDVVVRGNNLPQGLWDVFQGLGEILFGPNPGTRTVDLSIIIDQDLTYGPLGWAGAGVGGDTGLEVTIPAGSQIYPFYNGPSLGSLYPSLEALLSSLVLLDQTQAESTVSGQTEVRTRAVMSGLPLLPKGFTASIKLTPKFDTGVADWSATFPGAIRFGFTDSFGTPGIAPPSLVKYKWDPYGVTPSWVEITDGDITEGDVIFFAISGTDLPVGQGYWDNLPSDNVWAIGDANSSAPSTPGIVPNALAPYAFANANAQAKHSQLLTNLRLDTLSNAGPPTGAPTPDGDLGSVAFTATATGPLDQRPLNGWWGLWKINNNFVSADLLTGAEDLRLRVRNNISGGAEVGSFDIALVSEVSARPLAFGPGGVDLTSQGPEPPTEVGSISSVIASIDHNDYQDHQGVAGVFEVELGTGWVNQGATFDPAVDGDLVFNSNPGETFDGFRLFTQELVATEGVEITVIYRNKLAHDAGEAGQELVASLGFTTPSAGPSEPPLVTPGSDLNILENAVNDTVSVEVELVQASATVELWSNNQAGAPATVDLDGNFAPGNQVDMTTLFFAFPGGLNPAPTGIGDTWEINLQAFDPAGQGQLLFNAFGGSADLFVRNPDGKYAKLGTPITVTEEPAPEFVSFQMLPAVDHPPGQIDVNKLTLGETVTFEVTMNNGISNFDGQPARLRVLNGPDGVPFTSGGFPGLVATSVSGNVYTFTADYTAAQVQDTPLSISLIKSVPAGAEAITQANITAATFVELLSFQAPVKDIGQSSANFEVASVASQSVFQPLRGFTGGAAAFVAAPPQEGRFSTFLVDVNSVPDDATGSNLTVEFLDFEGFAVASSVTITSATKQSLTGTVLWNDNTAGKSVYVRVTDSNTAEVVEKAAGFKVGTPDAPSIRSAILSPAYEGTNGATLTFYGSNLVPRPGPSGTPTQTYSYSLFDSGDDTAFSSATLVSSSATELVFSVNIAPGVGGRSFGVEIDYLGGNTLVAGNKGFILEQPAGDPTITDVLLYGEFADPDGDNVQAPIPKADGTALLRIQGTNLGTANVDPGGIGSPVSQPGVYLEVVGEEDDGTSSDIKETAPGPGLSAALASPRIDVLSIELQTTTEIIARVPATIDFSNTRVRVWLVRPATHPDGAGEWDLATVDATGDGDARGLAAVGTTARYGQHARAPKINVDPTQGVTQLDVARSLQSQVGPGSEGDTVTLTVRLKEAITTASAPEVLAVPSTSYGVVFKNIQVTKLASPFEIQITCTVPDPEVGNTYPDPAFTTATPVVCGLKFANGNLIASATLGANDWGDTGSSIAYA